MFKDDLSSPGEDLANTVNNPTTDEHEQLVSTPAFKDITQDPKFWERAVLS
ncbi:MAG: hypothetical protein H6Q68_991 [Firmicutes bacterium]|nr:hypothetical protein [Bacillota bacterium]